MIFYALYFGDLSVTHADGFVCSPTQFRAKLIAAYSLSLN